MWNAVKSTRQYVLFAIAVTLVLFGFLLVQTVDLAGLRASLSRPRRAAVSRKPAPARVLPAPAPAREPRKAEEAPAAAGVDMAEENRQLRDENAALKGRLVAVLNWILTNFRGKYPLSESSMARLQFPALNENYTLHPELAEFLKITPGEEANINDALAYAKDYLGEIEAALITATNPNPEKVVLHIPAFPEDGKVLQEDLYSAIEITLGPDRFDRFVKVSESGLKSNFYQFGEAARTMVFELVYEDGQPAPQLKIKDGWIVELGPDSRMVTATESVVTNLPARYNAYAAWLPDYVVDYATP